MDPVRIFFAVNRAGLPQVLLGLMALWSGIQQETRNFKPCFIRI